MPSAAFAPSFRNQVPYVFKHEILGAPSPCFGEKHRETEELAGSSGRRVSAWAAGIFTLAASGPDTLALPSLASAAACLLWAQPLQTRGGCKDGEREAGFLSRYGVTRPALVFGISAQPSRAPQLEHLAPHLEVGDPETETQSCASALAPASAGISLRQPAPWAAEHWEASTSARLGSRQKKWRVAKNGLPTAPNRSNPEPPSSLKPRALHHPKPTLSCPSLHKLQTRQTRKS